MMRLHSLSILGTLKSAWTCRILSVSSRCVRMSTTYKLRPNQRYFHWNSVCQARGSRQVLDVRPDLRESSQLKHGEQQHEEVTLHKPQEQTEIEISTSQDQVLPFNLKGAEEGDIYSGIMKMKPKEIFYLLQHHHEELNRTHFALSMKRLYKIYKGLPAESKEGYKNILHGQEGFKLLCALLALKGEYYEPPIVADMLVFMHELGLDSLDPTMQVYLHLLSHNLHRLTLDVILKVMLCSVAMTMTSQVKLLRQGVKILAEKGQLARGIETLSIAELVNMLNLLGGSLPEDNLELLLKDISSREDLISPRLSVVLLKGLRHLGAPHYLEAEALHKIISKTEKLSPKEVADVLEACYDIDLYNFELLHKLESEALSKYDSLDQFRVSKRLYKFGYLSKGLLPAVLNSSDTFIDTLKSRDLLKFLEIVADGSHKLEICSAFTDQFVTRLERVDFSEMSLEEKLKCLTNLQVLGVRNLDVLSDLQSSLNTEEAVQRLAESSNVKHQITHPLWRLQMLNLVTGCESGAVLESSIQTVMETVPNKTVAMGNMIESALGIENSVITRPKSRNGVLVDHLVIMDENHRATDTSEKEVMFLEDFVLEDNQKIMSVMELPGICLHRNTRQLRGFYAWYMRQLQSRGHLVVLINTELFEMVEDEHKYEYIQRKMFCAEKFQDLVLLS